MSAPVETSDRSAKCPRPSFFRRWFGWLLFLFGQQEAAAPVNGGPSDPASSANDAFFASAGAEQLQLDAPKPTDPPASGALRPRLAHFPLGLKPSHKPQSPLAKAYADAARAAADNPVAGPETEAMPAASPPQWLVREPEDVADPTPHEAEQFLSWDGWGLIAASVRGKLHAHQALWRDDAFACAHQGPWTVIAVADGAGSVPLSRVGSHLACGAALASLEDKLPGIPLPEPLPEPLPPSDVEGVKGALVAAARRAKQAITTEADRRGRPTRDFHTTLLLVVHRAGNNRDLVGVLQVGDGAVGLYTARGTCSILGVADHGNFASETRFLTMPGIEDEFDSRVRFALVEDMTALAVMTDGVADDFFPEAQRLGELFTGNEWRVEGGEKIPPPITLHPPPSTLLDWLRYEKKGSSDDRTLALLFRMQGENA